MASEFGASQKYPLSALSFACICLYQLQGKLDAEIQLVTAEEAEQDPVGLARTDPNGLPPPK